MVIMAATPANISPLWDPNLIKHPIHSEGASAAFLSGLYADFMCKSGLSLYFPLFSLDFIPVSKTDNGPKSILKFFFFLCTIQIYVGNSMGLGVCSVDWNVQRFEQPAAKLL